MNNLTTFGPVRKIAELALDAIYVCDRLGIRVEDRLELEDRWLGLVSTPGGSYFPSRSSLSFCPDNRRICIIQVLNHDLPIIRKYLPKGIEVVQTVEWTHSDLVDVRLEGCGLPDWCKYPKKHKPYARATAWLHTDGLRIEGWTGVSSVRRVRTSAT